MRAIDDELIEYLGRTTTYHQHDMSHLHTQITVNVTKRLVSHTQ